MNARPSRPRAEGPTGRAAFMALAVRLAEESVRRGGGPFGAVIARDGRIVATGTNGVTSRLDPTAHAEVVAIRNACRALGDFRLAGCDLYASCEPCPMCLAAARWARIDRIYYVATMEEAAAAGFDDARILDEVRAPRAPGRRGIMRLPAPGSARPFEAWAAKRDRVPY